MDSQIDLATRGLRIGLFARLARPFSDQNKILVVCRDSDFKFKDVYAQAGYGEHFTSMKIRTGSFKAGVSKYAVSARPLFSLLLRVRRSEHDLRYVTGSQHAHAHTCVAIGQVDHMFYSGATCLPTHVLSLPQEDAIGSTGLPSPSWPSDHLSLCVRFMIGGNKILNPLSFEHEGLFTSADSQVFENQEKESQTEKKKDRRKQDDNEPDPEPREKKSARAICRCCGRQ